MHTDKFKELKAQGENLMVCILTTLNSDKQSALHELYKEEEPQSIAELCDMLSDYTLNLTLNFSSFPRLPEQQDKLFANVIQQLDTVVAEFHQKHAKSNGSNSDLEQDLRKLATFFSGPHLVIDTYYNYMLQPTQSKSEEPVRAKL